MSYYYMGYGLNAGGAGGDPTDDLLLIDNDGVDKLYIDDNMTDFSLIED